MGLGLLGRGVGDALFLAECGAKLTVTDLKTKEELKESLKKLKKFKNIKYVLGRHKREDFRNKDFILKLAGVPLDSIYIKEAKKHLLKWTKNANLAVLELDSWQLQGFGEARISPHISVFTNFLSDHFNYYKNDVKKYFSDKSYIYKFQNKSDVLVLGPKMKDLVKNTKSKILYANTKDVPKSWHINLLGRHNIENIACALKVAEILQIPNEIVKKAVKSFRTLAGRLEMIKKVRGISIYNDTNSTTPDAVIVALNSFSKKVILIMGGMDKGLEVTNLIKILPRKTKYIFLIPGSGGDKINHQKLKIEKVSELEEAIMQAMKKGKVSDVILFSPGFASFNMFKNEYDRGDQFMKIVKQLK